MVTWFTSDSAVSFSIQSATSSNFISVTPKAATAAWPPVHIVICSFTGIFLRQLVTRSSIAATFTWRAVASCPSEMCYCILLWYFQIPPQSRADYKNPSAKQACSFLSWLGQFFSLFSLVGINIRYLPKVPLRVTWFFIMRNLLSTLSVFALLSNSSFLHLKLSVRRSGG